MPDITMCWNKTCPSRYKCYRYMAIPSLSQSWSEFVVPKRRVKCNHFWSAKGRVLNPERIAEQEKEI